MFLPAVAPAEAVAGEEEGWGWLSSALAARGSCPQPRSPQRLLGQRCCRLSHTFMVVIIALSLLEEVEEKPLGKQFWCLARQPETPSVASYIVKLLSASRASLVSVNQSLSRSGEPSSS